MQHAWLLYEYLSEQEGKVRKCDTLGVLCEYLNEREGKTRARHIESDARKWQLLCVSTACDKEERDCLHGHLPARNTNGKPSVRCIVNLTLLSIAFHGRQDRMLDDEDWRKKHMQLSFLSRISRQGPNPCWSTRLSLATRHQQQLRTTDNSKERQGTDVCRPEDSTECTSLEATDASLLDENEVSMARLNKTQNFAIYEDASAVDSIHSPHSAQKDDPMRTRRLSQEEDSLADTHSRIEDVEEAVECTETAEQYGDADDERRQSAITSTSISSLPESAFETDYELGIMHKPYTPPSMRPTFRRPESVRRMQMSSPTSSERGLRRSVLSAPRARTPRSTRSSVKGSPRPKRYQEEAVGEETKDYPLVLLHITLLPVELRWSYDSMRDVLPANTLDDLQLLRSKASETIIQRGILIPHPREEYELLEERLLEALELKKERITKCGHFRARDSTSSSSSADSGVGSSVESSDGEVCATCHHHMRTINSAVSAGGKKWSIKVFAANGLMKAAAWSAGWTEMERVDVEILPWIAEDLQRILDARKEEEDARRRLLYGEEEARIRDAIEEQVQIVREEKRLGEEVDRIRESLLPHAIEAPSDTTSTSVPSSDWMHTDLPQVYRPKDIPLSLLLKNYIFLLAQDKRNIAIFALSALAFWLSLRAAVVSTSFEVAGPTAIHARHRSQYEVPLVSELVDSASYTPVVEVPAESKGLQETMTTLQDAKSHSAVDSSPPVTTTLEEKVEPDNPHYTSLNLQPADAEGDTAETSDFKGELEYMGLFDDSGIHDINPNNDSPRLMFDRDDQCPLMQ